MDWTSLYFKTSDLNVFILGTGEVATRRANRFLSHGANVRLVGNHLDEDLKNKGATLCSTEDVDELVEWADFIIVASGDKELSEYVSDISGDKLINRADSPDKGNIIVPTTFEIGDIEISIFTKGKSPLMAKQLRKKIQSIITEQDIFEIEIQSYARSLLKEVTDDQKERRKYLYEILDDENLAEYIQNNEMDKAKEYISELIKGI